MSKNEITSPVKRERERLSQYDLQRLEKAEKEVAEMAKAREIQETKEIPPKGVERVEWKSSLATVDAFFGGDKFFVMNVVQISRDIIYHHQNNIDLKKILGKDYTNFYRGSNEFASSVCIMLMAYSVEFAEKVKKLYNKNRSF